MSQKVGRLYVLIGLPGSGKTTFLQERFRVDHPEVLVLDDYQANAIADHPDPSWSRNRATAVAALKNGQAILISDVTYCRPTTLERQIRLMQEDVPGIDIELIHFSNDPVSAEHNLRLRAREQVVRELRLIHDLSKGYLPPADAMPIVRGTSGAGNEA
jgi:hypothetical protein